MYKCAINQDMSTFVIHDFHLLVSPCTYGPNFLLCPGIIFWEVVMVLGFELMASHRCSTLWTMPPAFFAPVILETDSPFLAKVCLNHNPPIYAFHHYWDDRHVPQYLFFSIEMGSHITWDDSCTPPLLVEMRSFELLLPGLKPQSPWSQPL
jgi:hypothetical protein